MVLATNIAETSVTVPGVRYVVDAGFVKTREYQASSGAETLRVLPISQAQAAQRSGRAGVPPFIVLTLSHRLRVLPISQSQAAKCSGCVGCALCGHARGLDASASCVAAFSAADWAYSAKRTTMHHQHRRLPIIT